MSGWTTKKLGEVCEVVLGGTPRTSIDVYWGGSVPWLTPGDMGKIKGLYVAETSRSLTQQGLENGSKLFPENSVVLSTRAPIGYVLINTVPMCTNQGCKTLIPNSTIAPEYLAYNLIGRTIELNELGTGTTFKELSTGVLKNIDIPIPPLAEQKRIVAKIDAAFEKIDALKANAEKNLANAKELFQSALDEAMRPKKGWVEKRLGEVCEVLDSQRIPITKKDRKPGMIPYYGATKQVDSVADYIFDERLLLLGEDGADWSAGANSAYIIEGKSWVNNHAHVLRPMADIVIDVWLMFYLNATDLTKWVSGTTVPKLNQKNMCDIPVPIPPIREQTILAKSIEILSSKLETLQQNYAQQIADCAEMRQAILREAFEGRL